MSPTLCLAVFLHPLGLSGPEESWGYNLRPVCFLLGLVISPFALFKPFISPVLLCLLWGMSFLGEARSLRGTGFYGDLQKESVSALSGHVPMEVLTCTHVCVLRKTGSNGNRERAAGAQSRQKLWAQSRQSSQRNRGTNRVLCMCLLLIRLFYLSRDRF